MDSVTINKNKTKEDRVVIDLINKEGTLCFRLGRANFVRAGTPLAEHIHEGMIEIVLLIKGNQTYTINGQEYHLNSGQALLTLPGEIHSSGYYPEDKSLIYYMIINLNSPELSLGYDSQDLSEISENIYESNRRVIRITSKMKEICDSIIENHYSNRAFKNTVFRNSVSDFILETIKAITCNKEDFLPLNLQQVLEYIDTHINNIISVEQLAKVANLSVSRFKSLFRDEVGFPPKEYLLRRKVEYAMELLKSTNKSITDISLDLDFSSSQYFSTVFRRYTFTSPTAFRNDKVDRVKVMNRY